MGVVVIEWAMKHGGKDEKLAEIYLEETWSPRHLGGWTKTVEYFSEIM